MNALAAYSEVNMDPPSPNTIFIYLKTFSIFSEFTALKDKMITG